MMVVMAAAAMMVVVGLLEDEDKSFRARVDSEWYGVIARAAGAPVDTTCSYTSSPPHRKNEDTRWSIILSFWPW